LKKTELEGTVFTGEGNGKKYIALPWVKRQLKEKLGITPFLGTLNLKLTPQNIQRRKKLQEKKAAVISPPEGYCEGLLFKAVIGEIECAVVIPKIEKYPKDVLEVIASVNLRDALKLRDGDEVNVSVEV
jgi:riboflavin kinase, archaea type